jgi:hypothetical protein
LQHCEYSNTTELHVSKWKLWVLCYVNFISIC